LIQSSGKTKLPSATRIEVAAGDQLEIQTPGGGGWGEPESAGVSSVESSYSP
jgi:N-methylhydantoinase B/oxoprolinase/acetone carboxylase alpha subunit